MIYRPSQETGPSDPVGQGGRGRLAIIIGMEGQIMPTTLLLPTPHPFGFSNLPTALRDIVQKNAG